MKPPVYTRQMMIADERSVEKPFLMEIIEDLFGCKVKLSSADKVYGEPLDVYVMLAADDNQIISKRKYSEMSLLHIMQAQGIIFAIGNLIEFCSKQETVVYEKLL